MSTFTLKASEIDKKWHLIDATDLVVGRLAVEISKLLVGKLKPIYTPHMDCGDYVVVINTGKMRFTGKKMRDKKYYSHTGYPGGIKETTPDRLYRESKSGRVLQLAVKRMLTNNKLNRLRLSHLYVYEKDEHNHSAQKPVSLDVSKYCKVKR